MRRRTALLLAAAAVPGLLRAQEASVFMGALHARYGDSLAGSAGFASIRLATGGTLWAARVEASVSRFIEGGWAVQAGGQATALWPVTGNGRVWAGVAAGGAANGYQGGRPSGSVAGGPVGVWRTAAGYLSFGATGGALRRIDSTWQALATASVRWQWIGDAGVGLDLGASGTVAAALRFADASAALRYHGPSVRVLGVVGARMGDLALAPWGTVEIAWIPIRRVALELSAGRYPPDLTGFAEGLYVQAGWRLFGAGSGRGPAPVRRTGLSIRVGMDGMVTVRVRLRRAVGQVAIAGEWNDWEPIPLHPDGGQWIAALRLPVGVYRYGLLADGMWALPDGVTGIDDGLGGVVGILVVRPP